MLRELSSGLTGQSRPVGGGSSNSESQAEDEQENEEEVMFETKSDGLSGRKTYYITVNLREGKLYFKKQGITG